MMGEWCRRRVVPGAQIVSGCSFGFFRSAPIWCESVPQSRGVFGFLRFVLTEGCKLVRISVEVGLTVIYLMFLTDLPTELIERILYFVFKTGKLSDLVSSMKTCRKMYCYKYMLHHLHPTTVSKHKSRKNRAMPVSLFRELNQADLTYIKILNLDGSAKDINLSALTSLHTLTIRGLLRECCHILELQHIPASLQKLSLLLQFNRIRNKASINVPFAENKSSVKIKSLLITSNTLLMSSKVHPFLGKKERVKRDNFCIGDTLARIYCYFQPRVLELKKIETSLLFKNFNSSFHPIGLPAVLVAESLSKSNFSEWDAYTYKTVFVINTFIHGGLFLIVRNEGLWVFTDLATRNEWIERIKGVHEDFYDRH